VKKLENIGGINDNDKEKRKKRKALKGKWASILGSDSVRLPFPKQFLYGYCQSTVPVLVESFYLAGVVDSCKTLFFYKH